eukprot:scaffold4117_cov97-Cylindrotheca_fusiformis.AAC.5
MGQEISTEKCTLLNESYCRGSMCSRLPRPWNTYLSILSKVGGGLMCFTPLQPNAPHPIEDIPSRGHVSME